MRRNRDESLSPYGKISMGKDVGTAFTRVRV